MAVLLQGRATSAAAAAQPEVGQVQTNELQHYCYQPATTSPYNTGPLDILMMPSIAAADDSVQSSREDTTLAKGLSPFFHQE